MPGSGYGRWVGQGRATEDGYASLRLNACSGSREDLDSGGLAQLGLG